MRYYWNDKEVSVEEYQRLDEEWKQKCLEDERKVVSESASEKKSRKSKTS